MRVEILANARSPLALPQVPENRAVQAFLQAVNGEESVFRASCCEPVREKRQDPSKQSTVAGSFLLEFCDAALNRQRGQYFVLLETLRELLAKAGSEDFLEARLGLVNAADSATQAEAYSLFLELIGRGESAAQAELRWGLGVAHLQQAVLFSARLLRKKLSQQLAGGDQG